MVIKIICKKYLRLQLDVHSVTMFSWNQYSKTILIQFCIEQRTFLVIKASIPFSDIVLCILAGFVLIENTFAAWNVTLDFGWCNSPTMSFDIIFQMLPDQSRKLIVMENLLKLFLPNSFYSTSSVYLGYYSIPQSSGTVLGSRSWPAVYGKK